jgi:hypothetical protein
MAGYAFPVGTTTSEYPSQTINTPAVTLEDLWDNYEGSGQGFILGSVAFPVEVKTKITSLYLNNNTNGILPIEIWRGSVATMGEYEIVHKTRVQKTKFVVFPVVTGDSRSDDITATETMLNEITLNPGDYLAIVCPFNNAIVATTNVLIGVK